MRKKVIIVIIIWIALTFGVFLLTHKKSVPPAATSHAAQTTPPVVENGGSGGQGIINIQGTAALENYLLAQQFVAVKQAIDQYIQSNVSSSVLSATVVSGSTVLNYNGSINFSVQIAQPSTTFNVLLQLPTAEEIIFNVVGTSYQNALYPYATGGNTE